MAKITAITSQTKNKDRVNIFLDGEYSFSVSLDTVLNYHLKSGEELTEKEIEEITTVSDKEKALNKGLTYVSKTLKTKKQVKTYLFSKGYSPQTVDYVINKLIEFGFINDIEYAKRYMETYSKTQGKRLIDYNLMTKGVKKTDIAEASEGIEISSKENAAAIAEKRLKNKELNRETIAKTYRYLIGRGFSYEDAEYAISKFKEEN